MLSYLISCTVNAPCLTVVTLFLSPPLPGAMYIFVLQWPPAIKAAIQASQYGAGSSIPFGTVFSCFMASCLLGSTAFGESGEHIVHLDETIQ